MSPLAAGFTFHTQLFILDWGEGAPGGDLMISNYTQRTAAMWDRRKSIFMPSRVNPASVWTHGFDGVTPYKQ